MNSWELHLPGYRRLHSTGELKHRADKAVSRLSHCAICAQACNVNRLQGETGVCKTGRFALVSSHGPHYGEEDVLVGSGGSGTIFFANCNLGCIFCQNYDISAYGAGRKVTAREAEPTPKALRVPVGHYHCPGSRSTSLSKIEVNAISALRYTPGDTSL